MMISRLLPMVFAITVLQAEVRTWTSEDGQSSFVGEFLSHDTEKVTVRREQGDTITFDIKKLCEDDRNWLAGQGSGSDANEEEPDPNAVFDTLCFGDDRKKVEAKLLASSVVETTHEETFFGRIGLNGVFKTKQKIGGLHCELYFDWNKQGGLKEITIQSEPQASSAYSELLRANWKELSSLMTSLHGNPLQKASYPKIDDLQNDVFLGSHLWRLRSGGSALLGTSMQADKYMVVVRFSTERIEPVRVASP